MEEKLEEKNKLEEFILSPAYIILMVLVLIIPYLFKIHYVGYFVAAIIIAILYSIRIHFQKKEMIRAKEAEEETSKIEKKKKKQKKKRIRDIK